MKKHTKTIALLLSVVMLLGLICVPSVQDSIKDTFGYASIAPGVAERIPGSAGEPAVYTIPVTVDLTGDPVKDDAVTVGDADVEAADGESAVEFKGKIVAAIVTATVSPDGWSIAPNGTNIVLTATENGKKTSAPSVTLPDIEAKSGNTGVTVATATLGTGSFTNEGKEAVAEVPAVNLAKIEVTTQPTKKTYTAGDIFDKTGMVITATYSNGEEEATQTVSTYEVSTTPLTAGTTELEVSYTEKGQNKTTNVTGLTVNAAQSGTPSDDDPGTPGDGPGTPGDEKTVSSIAITNPPTKIVYTAGESFSKAGMVVTATYSDSTTANVTGEATVTPSGALTAGTTSVSIHYGGKSANVSITVNAAQSGTPGDEDEDPPAPKVLQSITIKTKPKTVYKSHELLTTAGMVVEATYSDNTNKVVTGWTVNPAAGTAVTTNGFKVVTVSYTENGVTKTATYEVKVDNKQDNGSNGPKSGPELPESNLKGMLKDEDVREVYAVDDVLITVGATAHKLEYSLTKNGAKVSWKTMTDNRVVVADEGAYEFRWRVTDTDSKKTTTSDLYKIYLDYTAPATPTFETKADPKGAGLEVTISVKEDNGSPLENIYYRIDDEDWAEYDKDKKPVLTLDEDNKDKEYTVEAYAIDKCENESDVGKKTVKLTAKDLLAMPTVKTSDKSPSNESIEYKLDVINDAYTYEYQYVEKGENPNKSEWEKATKNTSMEIDEEGEWELYIRVSLDNEDIQDKVAECVIDRTSPTVKKVTAPTGSNSGKTVTITVEAEDDLSEALEYSFDNGAHWQSNNSYRFKTSTTIRIGDVQVRDECGNVAYAACSYKITISGGRSSCTASSEFYMKNNASFNPSAISGGYMNGTSETTFDPDKEIPRSQFAAILNRTVNFGGGVVGGLTASDVATNYWAYADIVSVQRYGMFELSGGKFMPEQLVTRGEVAHALCQFIDLDNINPSNVDLSDIAGSPYEEDIVKVYAAGIMQGYGGSTFGPNNNLTRAQIVTIINRLINISESAAGSGRSFDDVPTSHWAYNDIMKATRSAA